MNAWLLVASMALLPAAQTPAPAPVQTPAPASSGHRDRIEIAGEVSVLADVLPKKGVAELRPAASLGIGARLSDVVRVRFDGFAEALVADRGGRVTDAGFRVREAWLEAAGPKGDLRAGYGRIVWGRLDEVQPSDVINPLDSARFLFDGRSAARLPVTFVRGRLFVSERLVVEGVGIPAFRRGSFDELDEASSPFNLLGDLILPASLEVSSASAPRIERIRPRASASNLSGGGRVSATFGRVDVAVGVFRGFEGFGLVSFEVDGSPSSEIGPLVVGHLVERFPRFTMVAGDFETIAGAWALRGEMAAFVDRKFLSRRGAGMVDGRALDGGVGFDRRTGEFRVFGSLLVHREWSAAEPEINRTEVSVVGSIERSFGRERYLARAFCVVNPADASGFIRGLAIWKAGDNAAIEVSAAAFLGTSAGTLGRFRSRDFLLIRIRGRV